MEMIIAGLALVTSVCSIIVAVSALKHQQRHDILSVKPICEITGDPYEDHLSVEICNYGSGPMVIRELKAYSAATDSAPTLYDCMQEVAPPLCISHWSINLEKRCIPAGSKLTLIRIEHSDGESAESSPSLRKAMEACQRDLATTTISVVYEDIYGNVMPTYSRKLSVFDMERVEA